MDWSSRKKKEGIFCTVYFVGRRTFLTFVFYHNVQCIEYTSRIYILLNIKKYYLIHFCRLFLKSSKASSVFLSWIMLPKIFYLLILPVLPQRILAHKKCLYNVASVHLVWSRSLALRHRTISRLILKYSKKKFQSFQITQVLNIQVCCRMQSIQ